MSSHTNLSIDQRIAALAARQHGAFTTAQLREASVTRAAVKRRVASGMLRRVLPRVYVSASTGVDLPKATYMSAALLCSREPRALAFRTAFDLHGIWTRRARRDDPERKVHVLIPWRQRDLPVDWIMHHRSEDWDGTETTVIDGLVVTNLARTICDGGSFLTRHQLANMVREAAYHHELPMDEIGEIIARRFRWPGSRVVADALELYRSGSAGTRSWAEDHLLAGLLVAPLPMPRVNVRGAAHLPGYEPDFAWPDARVIVEVDGGGHLLIGEPESDAARDEWLRSNDWLVLRFPAEAVYEGRQQVIECIVDTVQRRLGESTTRSASEPTRAHSWGRSYR